MRIPLGFVIAASGFLAVGATAQMVAPPPPPGGGLMRADANHDGIVTRAEMVADAEARFDRFDTNRDGKLDAAELAATRPMRGNRRGGDMPPPPPPADPAQ